MEWEGAGAFSKANAAKADKIRGKKLDKRVFYGDTGNNLAIIQISKI